MNRSRPKRFQFGLISGCWDLLHDGHRMMLSEALQHCELLTVLVASDDWIRRCKLREPAQPLELRCANIRAAFPQVVCTHAVEGDGCFARWAAAKHFTTWRHHSPDVLIVSEDQLHYPEKLATACKLRAPALILPRSPIAISTTELLEQRRRADSCPARS